MRSVDKRYYRKMISHRAAVTALEDINMALSGNKRPFFYSYSVSEAGDYDCSVRSMAIQIRKLVAEVAEYRALKDALKPIVKEIK